MSAIPSPARRRASLVGSPTPQSPHSQLPRPQSASGRYRSYGPPPSDPIPSVPSSSNRSSSPTAEDNADKGQVRVVLRIRPSEPEDPNIPSRHRSVLVHPTSSTEVRVSVDPATLAGSASVASTSKRHPTFTFDRVLGEQASQIDLYNVTARERIEEFLRGFNVTFLAYGQTSSGKSYSMGTTGDEEDYLDLSDHSRAGLIPRTVEQVFRRAEEIRLQSGPGASWECCVSFLELYNEDLIDLLSNTNMPVSIRENQDGRIVWSGVREIKVANVSEVMQLLSEGSLRRRTGETNMNQTSSRSHAIFALTLIQTRRADSGNSDAPSGRMTPSRRPMSVAGGNGSRSTTPVFTRAQPPSSYSKLMRPSSMYTGGGAPAPHSEDELVVVTSKFNLVDLAGSERLKRTGAQAERMKEGISINSGLLALGNVISALAEPAKNRGHVPYRDSKLTRLLQDSIGGNAMTTMIACISPLEYNISETINTINYASRARRIKNSVSKNQSEVGWDDIDYLRNTVLKLRTKISTLEANPGAAVRSAGRFESSVDEEALARQVMELTDKLADLEDDFSHLQDQYFEKCREIVALSDPDALEDDKLRQFNETIEPVVLEYEKVVTSLNNQLAMLRAEAAAREQSHEEQAHDLIKTQERLSEHESYVTELQGRLTKLTARNESSEAYIRDLEQKFRNFTDNDDRQTDVIAGLSKEIQDLKAESAKSNTYITQLEQRIATADNRATELADLVERYEREAEERESTVRDLESRMAMVDNQQDVNLLLEELESRERRIQELEDKLSKSKAQTLLAGAAGAATASAATVAVSRSAADMPEDVDEDDDDLSIVSRPSMEAKQGEPEIPKPEEPEVEAKAEVKDKAAEESSKEVAEEVPEKLETPTVKEPEAEEAETAATNGHVEMPREIDLSDDLPEEVEAAGDADITPKKSAVSPTVALAKDVPVPALEPSHDAPKSTSPTPPETPALRTIAEDSESEVDILRKENEALLMRLREIEMRHEMQHPATPALEPPSEHDEELEDEDEERDGDSTTNNKRGSTGNESSESETTLQTPKLASRAVSPQIHTDDPLSLQRSPYAAFRANSIDARRINSERILRPLSLSQSINGLAYMSNSPRYSWSPPANGNGTLTAYERSPKFDRSPKRQSMPFESKPMRSVQSLEIDINLLQKAVTDRDAQLKQREAEIKYLTNGGISIAVTRRPTSRPWKRKLNKEHNTDVYISKHDIDQPPFKERLQTSLLRPFVLMFCEPIILFMSFFLSFIYSLLYALFFAFPIAFEEIRGWNIGMTGVSFVSIIIAKIPAVPKNPREGPALSLLAHSGLRGSGWVKCSDGQCLCSVLSAEAADLKSQNQELSKNRDSKQMIDRSSRSKLPPIGPPPTAPLPPLPAGREAILSPTLTNASLPGRTSAHEGSVESARSSKYDSHDGHAVSLRPESLVTVAEVEKALAEREEALASLTEARDKLIELESSLGSAQKDNEAFTKDLIELRKNNSKLKVRVDDVNREMAELKRERDSLRRDLVEIKNELADCQYERIADRQRLEASKTELAQCKAKLDRMVDAKVSKRSDQKLKCF
ncbi:hypothetical protein A1Q2_01823 [Trichosporon asahii var. asahii CBS 8904]|uniref:Kinesin motor domain-containing protein n=1 Tax=Trichosporon asahii var. asahii (strain CBS 8904) TaxID=1220162 RepID=K1VI55_TRIAC|nr:hypothetical protein A1Q2_01823 [Trichosporon asahii var. asahii CBS 8904]